MQICAYTALNAIFRTYKSSAFMEELDPVFSKVARYFSLLSDASRLKVIHSICNVEHSVSDVVAETGLAQSAVSRHLSALHVAGVASRRKDGTRALYVISDRTLTEICRTACVSLVAREEEIAAQLTPIRDQAERFMPDNLSQTPAYIA
jgi:DNA-binding transcriptional ArsR family regulator